MPLPLIGTDQASLPFDGLPPFVRSRAMQHWRNCDGVLAPLTRQAVSLGLRTSPTTVYDSTGATIALPAVMPAWSAEDWDDDGVREELLLCLSGEEPLCFFDVDSLDLYWRVAPLTVFHPFMWDGPGPLWSFTNDAASGAWLQLAAESDGTITWQHHNGTSMVQSVVGSGLTVGDRCEPRAEFRADGSVRVDLVVNGGNEVAGTPSVAHTPAAVWGGGSGCQARINAFGTAVIGQQRLRSSAVYYGLATRRELLGML